MRRALMALIAFASVSVYLGLAIWARGGWRAFTAEPALVTLLVVSYLIAAVAPFTQGNLSRGVQEDRGNRWVIPAFAVIGLADGFLPAACDRTGTLILDFEGVRWVGVGLYAAGCVLRLAPVFVLGRRFSCLAAIQPDHALKTDGLYAVVRNPSYVGMLVITLGWALAFRSWAGVALTAAMLPPLIARMHAEERLLGGQFGEAYAAYRARTWRLVPWLY